MLAVQSSRQIDEPVNRLYCNNTVEVNILYSSLNNIAIAEGQLHHVKANSKKGPE